MIQRIQTLFLLLIASLSCLLFIYPFETVVDGSITYLVSLKPGALLNNIQPTIYIPIVINAIIIVLSLYIIFQFKRRHKQINFTQVLLVLSTLLIGSLFVFPFIKPENPNPLIDFSIIAFIPAINIILALLARFFIIKDEKLVRSADRIR